jgi:hypothetical protein
LVHQRRWAEAADTLAQLKQKSWPARFENGPENLRGRISNLEQKLEQGRKIHPL